MAARVTQMEDGEIAGSGRIPMGKRPWERRHWKHDLVPNRRGDHSKDWHPHESRSHHRRTNDSIKQKQQQQQNLQESHNRMSHRRRSHSPTRSRSRSRSCDRSRRSISSIPRHGKDNSSILRNDSTPRVTLRNQQNDFVTSSTQDSSVRLGSDDRTLMNRWIPPQSRRNDILVGNVVRIESKLALQADEAERPQQLEKGNDKNVKILKSIGGESKGDGKHKSTVSTTDMSVNIQPGTQNQNGEVSEATFRTNSVESKINKWLCHPKWRKISKHEKRKLDRFHLPRVNNIKPRGDCGQSTGCEKDVLVANSVLTSDIPRNSTAKKEVHAGISNALPCETSSNDVVNYSPSIVSEDGPPYATEISCGSSKGDLGPSVKLSKSIEWHGPGLIYQVPDLPPPPVISTIHACKSTHFEETSARAHCVAIEGTRQEMVNDDSDSESDTDDEEVMLWAEKMFGVTPPGLQNLRHLRSEANVDERCQENLDDKFDGMSPKATNVHNKRTFHPNRQSVAAKRKQCNGLEEVERMAAEEGKRKKEEAKPLTGAEIRAILGEDFDIAPSSHWVRRSSRQPCKAALQTPGVRALLDKLRHNDLDMIVLKMKKYVNDPDTPQVVIDAVLDALEENTNCEALYIQNFNRGMRDEQVLHLLKILQLRSCKIWCLNIGETYNVKSSTWKKFARGLRHTNVTHMYASEHTIDGELKDRIRETIRGNRKKHDMHCNPENLDVILQCTHCWWNPVNARVLRPYLRNKGYEYILKDKEAQGLRGTVSGATLGVDCPAAAPTR